jgi:hypothetical protein
MVYEPNSNIFTWWIIFHIYVYANPGEKKWWLGNKTFW